MRAGAASPAGTTASPNGAQQQQRFVFASLLVSEPDESMVLVQEGIQDYVREHDLSLQFLSPSATCENPFVLLDDVESLGVHGVVILPYPGDNHVDVLAGLRQRNFPAVCVE